MRTTIAVALAAVCVHSRVAAQDAPIEAAATPDAPARTEPTAPTWEGGPDEAGTGAVNVDINFSEPAEPAPPATEPRRSPTSRTARAASEVEDEDETPPARSIFLHGFRLGYLYVFGVDDPLFASDPAGQTYSERYGMRTPHLFLLGYELAWRVIGHDWLNLLVIGNFMIGGIEQSRFFPSANLMLGFELAERIQVGIGASLTPTKEDPAHMVFAAGWTPRIGSFYVPVHFFFVPDLEGHHKIGATVGINFD